MGKKAIIPDEFKALHHPDKVNEEWRKHKNRVKQRKYKKWK